MRFEGRLTSWNDDRGFGFIEANEGGEPVFMHIKAFPAAGGRPQLGQVLSFEIELGPQAKKRAIRVQRVLAPRPRRTAPGPRPEAPARWSTASALAIPLFAALYWALATRWGVSAFFALAYVVLSLMCFFAYALDKSAARANRRRTPESTLLFLGLIGGWPGAILAQQALRHKSSKAAFRASFWGTVLLNVAAFIVLNTPLLSLLRG